MTDFRRWIEAKSIIKSEGIFQFVSHRAVDPDIALFQEKIMWLRLGAARKNAEFAYDSARGNR